MSFHEVLRHIESYAGQRRDLSSLLQLLLSLPHMLDDNAASLRNNQLVSRLFELESDICPKHTVADHKKLLTFDEIKHGVSKLSTLGDLMNHRFLDELLATRTTHITSQLDAGPRRH